MYYDRHIMLEREEMILVIRQPSYCFEKNQNDTEAINYYYYFYHKTIALDIDETL